jgi:hypothetical protein
MKRGGGKRETPMDLIDKTRVIQVISCLVFLFILSASFSPAQPAGTKPPMGIGMKAWRGDNKCWKASDLDLSSDQVKGLDLINQAYLREIRPLRAELFSKRMELREFLTNATIKPESIQLKTSEIIGLESKIEEREIEYLVKVRSLLTQEQLKVWCPEQEFPSLRGMMQRPEFMRPMNPGKPPSQEKNREK